MGQRLSRVGFRELLDGISLLPSVKAVDLSNNGITDEYQEEILHFFDMPKVKSINLSRNYMKKLGAEIGKKMRDNPAVTHIKWIDLTQNDFDSNPATIQTIIMGLKKQGGSDGM